MKKLINLIALVMLVSTNVFTPFSYAQDVLPEVIPENEVETVDESLGEVGEITEISEEFPEINEETPGLVPEGKGEIEQKNREDETPENVLPDVQNGVETPATDETEKIDTENQDLQKPEEISTMDTATNSKNIVLQATATEAGQTLKINKYFKNAYTVSRCDGCETLTLSSDTGHTYEEPGTYTITLSLTGSATRWTFQNVSKPLVPTNGTTVTDVKIVSMPSLADGFGNSETNPGNSFFYYFNYNGKLTSLPEGSFDTSNITTVGDYFFYCFNYSGLLTSLPEGSFDTSNITTVNDSFFSYFNYNGSITSLPANSFDMNNVTIVGANFFGSFNDNGQLTSLPEGSFDTSNITTVNDSFFSYFNYNGSITSLPANSFDTSNITTVGDYFFANFNYSGALESLPEGSFDTSNITTVGDYFFASFNYNGKLTSLPEGSFDISNISGQLLGHSFFEYFNNNGQLRSLPEGSFDTSNISKADMWFFNGFNSGGQLRSLPEGSFDTSNLISVGANALNRCYFFSSFNQGGALESLPEGSFDTSNVVPRQGINGPTCQDFFSNFNQNGHITYLPDSFKLSSAGASSSGYYKKQYYDAFNSLNYTINRKVSDLVSGVTVPLGDRNVFSDNQPGRCGVHPNWLETIADACSISYDDGLGGTGEFKYTADTTGVVVGSGMVEPEKVGYIFSGWIDASGNKVEEIVFPDMDGQTLYANWTPNEYTITFEDSSEENEKIVISGLYLSDTSSIKYPKWRKEGYKIVWDKEIPATMPAENMVIKASWEKNGSSGGGGGGGGTKPDTPKNEQQPSQSDASSGTNVKESETNTGSNIQTGSQVDSQLTGQASEQTPQNDNSNIQDSSTSSQNDTKTYSTEFQEAYEFAKGNGITTMPTIQKADMNGKLTRIQMAKMLSQYAINVLGQTPDTSKTVKFKDVTAKRDADYDNGVTLAYQLGIMGQNMPGNNFRPNDEVTRAEFATALSRLLYHTTDGEYKSTKEYYIPHMAKLYNEGIINNTNPSMAEKRGYVMIMLMRSAK